MIRLLAQPLVAWLAAGAAALGGLLALPIWPAARAARPALDAVLVDVSGSVLRPRPDWLPWVRGELAELAGRAAREGHELAVLAYADGVATLFGPGPAEDFRGRLAGTGGRLFDPLSAELPDLASDLRAALERAAEEALAPGRAPGRVVLLGTDVAGRGSPEPPLARLAAGGVVFERRPPPAASRVDVALVELRLPRAPAVGTALTGLLEVELRGPRALHPTSLALELERRGPEGLERRTLELPLVGGGPSVAVPLDLGPVPDGRTQVAVRVLGDPRAPDPFPENDRLERTVTAGERRLVGLLVDPSERGAAAAWAARFDGRSGLQWRATTTEELLGELDGLDALVAWDVPLGSTLRDALRGRVRAGLGLATLLGWRAVADAAGPELAALEPAGREREPRRVLLLVDGSGSMAGETFEQVRRAAVELAAAVPREDRLSLRFFTSVLQPPVSLDVGAGDGIEAGGRDRSAVARRVLEARRPSGPTALLASLEALAEERAAEPPGEALVLLLTDGREEDDPIREAERRRVLVASLAASRTRLRALALGERAVLGTLEPLVERPEHLVRVGPEADLAALVVRTALGEDLARGSEPVFRGTGPLVAEVLGPPPAERTPITALRQRLPARPVAGAEAAWTTDDGAAVLGLARSGAGRLATLALTPSADWSPELALDPRPLLPVLRWLAAGPRVSAPRARLERDAAGEPWLVVERLGPEAPDLLSVRLRPADAAPSEGGWMSATPPAGPGRADERRAPGPSGAAAGGPEGAGAPVLELALPDGPRLVSVALPPPAEAGAGRPLPPLPEPRADARPARRAGHPAAPLALAAAFAAATAFGTAAALRGRGIKAFVGDRR